MKFPLPILRFLIDQRSFALELSAVDRVVRAVEVAPLPAGPEVIEGLVNVGGEIVPVLSIRRRFGLRDKPVYPDQALILARTVRRRVAMVADELAGVETVESFVPREKIEAPAIAVRGVVQGEDGLIIIQDLEDFLLLNEEEKLAAALGRER